MNTEVSSQIFRHAKVVGGVCAIGGKANLDNGIRFFLEIVGGTPAKWRIGGQHDDACVVVTETEFVFGADHTLRGNAFYLAFANGEQVAVFAENVGARHGEEDYLPGSHIGRTAHNGAHDAVTNIYCCGR